MGHSDGTHLRWVFIELEEETALVVPADGNGLVGGSDVEFVAELTGEYLVARCQFAPKPLREYLAGSVRVARVSERDLLRIKKQLARLSEKTKPVELGAHEVEADPSYSEWCSAVRNTSWNQLDELRCTLRVAPSKETNTALAAAQVDQPTQSEAETVTVISPKKLIEVALPLDIINEAADKEKNIRRGNPSTLHLWWARRPLAAARAVIFSQLVHDPEDLWRCKNPGKEPNQQERGHWTKARAKLFAIIEDLVKWENTTNETVLNAAREEIRKSWRETCDLNKHHPQAKELFDSAKMPGLHDPFAGGGSIPLEAQRLGLEAYASDLNPVAVLINKAMIEIPPKFAGRAPVHPKAENALATWSGAQGLAEDVRLYGQWMRDEAFKRIGYLYPPVEITKEMVKSRPDLKQYAGEKLTVIAWLWARTVRSPNPAFSHVDVPLVSTFILSSKEGKEAYVQPVKDGDTYHFTVKTGTLPESAKAGTTAGKRAAFICLMSKVPMDYNYIRNEGQAGRMGQKLMAIVAEGTRGRVYLEPTVEHEALAATAKPEWEPDLKLPDNPRDFKTPNYGLRTFGDLFTARQLVALVTFSDLVGEVRERIRKDAVATGLPEDDRGLVAGGTGVNAYADAVSVYLGMGVSKLADYSSTIVVWSPTRDQLKTTFTKQALPMSWDYAETNVFAAAAGDLSVTLEGMCRTISSMNTTIPGQVVQCAAQAQVLTTAKYVSTDPPYYDNIGYADLSDFFYVWQRRSLGTVFSSLFATISVPKAEELDHAG